MNITIKTLKNGVTLLYCFDQNIAVPSFNIWLRHQREFGKAHLLEHLISGYHKVLTKKQHPVAINAMTDDQSICFFARGYPNVSIDFFKNFISSTNKLLSDDNYASSRIEKEMAVIDAEMQRTPPSRFSKLNEALGVSLPTKPWIGGKREIIDLAGKLLSGNNMVVCIVGALESADLDIIEDKLEQAFLSGIAQEIPSKTFVEKTLLYDTDNCVNGILFPVFSESNIDYQLMMVATKLFTSKYVKSLSSVLRDKGLAYTVDRNYFLTDQRGIHAIYTAPSFSHLESCTNEVEQFFQSDFMNFPENLLLETTAEVSLYQKLSIENAGVYASRIGKHYMNYGSIPSEDFMTSSLNLESSSLIRGYLKKFYFSDPVIRKKL